MGGVRVVLCDDAAPLRELTRYGLEQGSRVRVVAEAEDAATGIRRTAELRPDCVLLDLSMPGMDGLEAIPLLREASPETAIVVFSGFAADRLEATVLRLGADRYVQKGDDFAELRRTLIEACAERGCAA